ncbi:MAG: LLM class flavin-dependent oxidoreductase [Acidimicrobiia bacterium]|nr:LLM class flavin-dependent oxidoreductase [Acidimicrobiia bacterium]
MIDSEVHVKLAATMGTNARPPTVDFARRLEAAGFDSIWTAEDWGLDAVSQLAWIGSHTERITLGTSIMQVPSRSPGLTAMTAATMASLSGGRFVLGLGPSGPLVVEGWHGVPYGRPLAKTREYVSIVRRMLDRDGPCEHDGVYYQLPYRGDDSTGLGKALRLNTRVNHEVPIYVSAMGPTALAMGAEIADGVIATLVDADRLDDLEAALQRGLDAGAKHRGDVTVVASVSVVVGNDVAACFDLMRPQFARTIGGYGASTRNFYVNQITRGGWGDIAARVQELYLAGRRDEAAAAIPGELLDAYSLVGPPDRVAARARRYEQADVLMLVCHDADVLETIAEAVAL